MLVYVNVFIATLLYCWDSANWLLPGSSHQQCSKPEMSFHGFERCPNRSIYIYISWMSLSKNDTPIYSHNLGNPCGVCLKILKMCLCLFRAPYPPIYGKFNRENKPSKTGVVLLYQRRSYTSSSAMATKFDKSTIFAQARKDPNFFPLKEYFILGYYEYYS